MIKKCSCYENNPCEDECVCKNPCEDECICENLCEYDCHCEFTCACPSPEKGSLEEFIFECPNLIDQKLKSRFKKHMLEFENKEPVDWHPWSDEQVRDLIHPSLYCYVKKQNELDKYQWLPSDVDIINGNAVFKSYINNLDEYKYPELKKDIQNIFTLFVPKFKEMLGQDFEKCQVIVKAANIELTPEKPIYSGGSWHLEGMPYEQIVGTVG